MGGGPRTYRSVNNAESLNRNEKMLPQKGEGGFVRAPARARGEACRPATNIVQGYVNRKQDDQSAGRRRALKQGGIIIKDGGEKYCKRGQSMYRESSTGGVPEERKSTGRLTKDPE